MTGETSTGFAYEMDDDVRDDAELLESLLELNNGDGTVVPKLAEQLLGAEGKKALYDHCRGENGRVRLSLVSAEIREVLENVTGAKKN